MNSHRTASIAVFISIGLYSFAFAQPPPQPAVNPGEFEPMTGVIIAFPPPLPMSLVAEMSEDVNVMSVVPNVSVMQSAITAYGNSGVNLNNCTFLICPSSANLSRDNGPWYIFNGDDIQGIADNINNAGTPIDSLPWYIGDSLNIPVYNTNLVIQGGNWMSDGMGKAVSSAMVYAQNPSLTVAQINSIMRNYLGVENYFITEGYGGFDFAHVDTWAKFLDPGRILVKRYNPPVPELEALAHYLSTLMSSYGRPYEILRIDNDYTTAYTNSLFLNNKVLVPLFNNPLDSLALGTWSAAMPGYEVLGFPDGGWGPGNALHCRTMGITDRYMLRITHIPLFDRENDGNNYVVQANVHAYSNMPLAPGMPRLYWKVEGGNYNIVTMTHTVGDSFAAVIPEQPDNTQIYYYIHAEDNSNRSENHPYIGPGNPHHFSVGPDIEPPIIEIELPEVILPNTLPLQISAEVSDNRWITSVTLEFMINNVPADTLAMTLQPLSAVIYEALLNPQVIPGDRIQLRIKAVDNAINQNTTYSPAQGYYNIEVAGEIEVCLWNPCAQASGQEIYDFFQRAGIQSFYSVAEPEVFERYTNIFICMGSWPNSYSLNLAQVNKIADYIQSGHCAYLEGTDAWAYSPYHLQLSQAFGIVGIYDGPIVQSVNPLLGITGTFTAGMSFNSNNSHYVDRIAPAAGSESIFLHADTSYGVIHETLNYRTVGLSVEFGSLNGNNTSSTKGKLLREIFRFFRLDSAFEYGLLKDEINVIELGKFRLGNPSPNPFNASTTISYNLPFPGEISLVVYDVAGREIAQIASGLAAAGNHSIVWNAENTPSGVYFLRLFNETNDISVKKVVLLK